MAISEKKVVVTKADTTCTVIHGDSRIELPSFSGLADLIVTSPPYADARKKHYDSVHPDKFAEWFLTFNEAFYNTLKPTGSLVINIKDKVVKGVKHRYVWRTIDALCQHGWYSIEDYIWHKTNPMPGRWPNRLRDGWEYCFHLTKSKRPYFNPEAVRRPIGDWVASRLNKLGQNDLKRHNSANASGFGRDISRWVGKQTVSPSNVLSLALVGKNKGHPAVYPTDLPLFFIKLLCPEDGLVIDPFAGSGTTGIAALSLGRRCVLIENSAEYCEKALQRLRNEGVAQKDELENGLKSVRSRSIGDHSNKVLQLFKI
ncbi:MAG: site-specific DNA-methyltransferase [Deltaproteobacteria bacterium]|nr:site-specific DNA-methyltransferase [Deltaproteobacteria bacterium]